MMKGIYEIISTATKSKFCWQNPLVWTTYWMLYQSTKFGHNPWDTAPSHLHPWDGAKSGFEPWTFVWGGPRHASCGIYHYFNSYNYIIISPRLKAHQILHFYYLNILTWLRREKSSFEPLVRLEYPPLGKNNTTLNAQPQCHNTRTRRIKIHYINCFFKLGSWEVDDWEQNVWEANFHNNKMHICQVCSTIYKSNTDYIHSLFNALSLRVGELDAQESRLFRNDEYN